MTLARADGWGSDVEDLPAEITDAIPRALLLRAWIALERLQFATNGRFDSVRFAAARAEAEATLRLGPRLYERRRKKRVS